MSAKNFERVSRVTDRLLEHFYRDTLSMTLSPDAPRSSEAHYVREDVERLKTRLPKVEHLLHTASWGPVTLEYWLQAHGKMPYHRRKMLCSSAHAAVLVLADVWANGNSDDGLLVAFDYALIKADLQQERAFVVRRRENAATRRRRIVVHA